MEYVICDYSDMFVTVELTFLFQKEENFCPEIAVAGHYWWIIQGLQMNCHKTNIPLYYYVSCIFNTTCKNMSIQYKMYDIQGTSKRVPEQH